MRAESYTVEEVKSRVLSKGVSIKVSSQKVEDGNDELGKIQFKAVPKLVNIEHERDMKPELFLSGPKQLGEVNVYVGVDGLKHYFDAKTGLALGSRLQPKPTRNLINLIPPPKSEPAPPGTDRRYLDRP